MKLFYPAVVLFAIWTVSVVSAKDKPQTGGKSSSNTVKWTDLVKGGKLPYGNNVTLTGQLSDLQCGSKPISDVLDITSISVSYLGQTSQAATAAITPTGWSAPLGALPADTAINLQLKITTKILVSQREEITSQLLEDPQFRALIKTFHAMAVGKDPTVFVQQAQFLTGAISDKNGALTRVFGNLLPSCVVTSDVTAAAVVGLGANDSLDLLGLETRWADLVKHYSSGDFKLDGYPASTSAKELYRFLKSQAGTYMHDGKPLTNQQDVKEMADLFTTSYANAANDIDVNVVAQLNQAVQLSQSSSTQDLNKYAGFDAGALYVPRINELRQFYMVHIYPWGPVELSTAGGIPFLERWSLAIGASVGDLSSNGSSRVKSDKAFVYGIGFRINKYFRISAGGMLYRDAVGNRLLNEGFLGPSIDITALPGLKTIFSSSSSKSNSSSSSSDAAAKKQTP